MFLNALKFELKMPYMNCPCNIFVIVIAQKASKSKQANRRRITKTTRKNCFKCCLTILNRSNRITRYYAPNSFFFNSKKKARKKEINEKDRLFFIIIKCTSMQYNVKEEVETEEGEGENECINNNNQMQTQMWAICLAVAQQSVGIFL